MNLVEHGLELPPWRPMSLYKDQMPKDVLAWSADFPPPEVGEIVRLAVNGCGPMLVEAYFEQEGFLGVKGHLQSPPEWFLKQNKSNVACYAFGAEIKLIEK